MSLYHYRDRIAEVLNKIWSTQAENITRAAATMAESIAGGGLVHLFGSGHSVIPVLDIFPPTAAFLASAR